MTKLHELKNTTKEVKVRKRVGRGIGSGLGKTCGRGEKGRGSRSGCVSRAGYEGGQFRLYMKLPIRGFSNVRFQHRLTPINLSQIDKLYQNGEVVSVETLRNYGLVNGKVHGIKILGNGELTKKVTLEVHAISGSAREKLQMAKIKFTLLNAENESGE